MTRKVLSILLSLCLILTLFTACSDDTLYPCVSNMVFQTRLPLSGISVGNADYVCAYKNIVFAVENDELIRYNLVDGDKSVIAEVGGIVGITCSGNNLAVLCDSSALIYTYAGEKIKDIPLSNLSSCVVDIALNSECLCIASDSEIYSVNLSDGSVIRLAASGTEEFQMPLLPMSAFPSAETCT